MKFRHILFAGCLLTGCSHMNPPKTQATKTNDIPTREVSQVNIDTVTQELPVGKSVVVCKPYVTDLNTVLIAPRLLAYYSNTYTDGLIETTTGPSQPIIVKSPFAVSAPTLSFFENTSPNNANARQYCVTITKK